MYTRYSGDPNKFGRPKFVHKAKPHFGGRKPTFNRNSKRSRGERIDFSRFIKKGTYTEEAPYVSKHTFANFSFNPQLHKNITTAGFIHPRPIQDQAIPSVMEGKDVFGMANTGTGKTAAFLLPLIDKKVMDLSTCHSVVLDEADRMLDMGFRDDMVYIIGKTSKERQTLFFSATLSPEIKKLTQLYLKEPVFISVISGETLKNIDQDVIHTRSKEEKLKKLHEVLKRDGSDKVLIFREMKHSVDTLAKELSHFGFKVGAIHGDKRSRERIRTLDSFKKDQINILIATDVAARGLDIPDVTHVINYDVPQTYDTYVHRIGRTGRSGKAGTALTFVPG